jgi:hypothetical protein
MAVQDEVQITSVAYNTMGVCRMNFAMYHGAGSTIAALVLARASAEGAAAQMQERVPTIPLYTVDALVGSGVYTARLGEVWYNRPNRANLWRMALSVRLGSAGRVRAVAIGDINEDGAGDQISICGLAPNRTCYQYFPTPTGLGLGLGLRAAATSRIGVGISAGALVRTGNSITRVPFVGAEASLRATRYLSVVGTVRHFAWRQSGVGRLSYRPVGFGLRLHPSPRSRS